ncbi:MAG: sugar ABC transporter permease [Roseitalea sp.]|jgi:ABC-type sugar transport system permease subunit|nr:sugar ABC transporter permease [Roseitalea sp.]MBO6720990.1 sugar ABC transporter permease [Roseitalea sp.]MBO6742938.1 sugar ABC transporter permease [Roseitalea sp.]
MVAIPVPAARPTLIQRLDGAAIFYVFALPFAALTIVMGLWPIALSIQTSFTESFTALSPEPTFVGLENYREIFADPQFIRSINLTLLYTVLSVALNLTVALAYALFLNSPLLGRAAMIFKLCVFLPVITPDLAGYIVWKWMYNTDFGAINAGLNALGLPDFAGTSSQSTAMISLLIAELWYHVGFYVIIFLANLAMIDKSLIEAARMDATPPWRMFTRIILPQLRPAIMINSVYALIQFLKTFTVVVVITKGGPAGSTNFVSYHAYQMFDQAQYGKAAAMASTLFAGVMVLAFFVYWLNQRADWR